MRAPFINFNNHDMFDIDRNGRFSILVILLSYVSSKSRYSIIKNHFINSNALSCYHLASKACTRIFYFIIGGNVSSTTVY